VQPRQGLPAATGLAFPQKSGRDGRPYRTWRRRDAIQVNTATASVVNAQMKSSASRAAGLPLHDALVAT